MKRRSSITLACALILLTACGGGSSSDPVAPPLSCSVADRNTWLQDYMGAWYLWTGLSPSPDPAPYTTVEDYFQALLYGGDATVPPDTFSYLQDTESYERFFEEGETLGYGLFLAAIEVEGQPDQPLRIRHIEPLSDAGAQGLARGDEILAIDGRSAAALITANDYGFLVPSAAGEQITLRVRTTLGEREMTLTASVYTLTPVPTHAIVDSPGGRKVGYVMVKDMIGTALPPLDAAFQRFRAAGVTEAVIDLRYNGGGRVSVGRSVASYVSADRTAGEVYAQLLYNAARAPANDQTFTFGNPAYALGLSRVYVLAGPRTCSASEQVVNGLAPFVDVVLVGDTTCGKPVGFLPTDDGCGTTVSAVNFESVNAEGVGRYYAGFAPQCPAADDLDRALGDPAERLLATALLHADTGACAPEGRRVQPLAARPGPRQRLTTEPGELRGMTGD